MLFIIDVLAAPLSIKINQSKPIENLRDA